MEIFILHWGYFRIMPTVSRFYFYIENHYQGMGNDSQTSKMIKFLSPRLIIQTEDFILISLTPLPSFCNCFYPATEGFFSTFMTEKQGKLKSQSILSLNVYFLKCFLLEKGKPIYVKGWKTTLLLVNST